MTTLPQELRLTVEEVTIILNEVWRLYGPSVEFRSPSHHYPLVKVSLEHMKAQPPPRSMLPREAIEDITWSDLVDCYYTAGVLKPENIKEIEGKLRRLSQMARQPLEPRKPAVAVDTNQLYTLEAERQLTKHREILPVIPEPCLAELAPKLELKATENGLRELKPEHAAKIRHRESKEARKAKLAYSSALLLLKAGAVKAPHEGIGDQAVANSIVELQRQQLTYSIHLMTADDNLRMIASARGIPVIYVKQPTDLPESIDLTYQSTVMLAYTLAAYTGSLELWAQGVRRATLDAVWPGKTNEEWVKRELKAEVHTRTLLQQVEEKTEKLHKIEEELRRLQAAP